MNNLTNDSRKGRINIFPAVSVSFIRQTVVVRCEDQFREYRGLAIPLNESF